MKPQNLLFWLSMACLAGCYDRQVVGTDADGDVDVDADTDTDADGDADGDGDGDAEDPEPWIPEVVDLAADDGESVALAVDPQGVPHLVYNWSDNTGDELNHERRYARLVDGRWAIETIEPILGSHMGSVVAIDPEGTVQVASIFMASEFSSSLSLRRSIRTNAGWQTEAVDGPSRMGGDLAMVLDAGGAMHVAYIVGEESGDRVFSRLRYATNASGAWAIEEVDPSEEAASVAIALDVTGAPRIAYLGGSDSAEAWLARRQGDGWQTERAAAVVPDPLARHDQAIASDGPMGLVVDGLDSNHLFVPGGELVYADDTAGAWASEQIPGTGQGGSYAIAAVQDLAGVFHTAWVEFGPVVQERFFAFGISYASGGPGAWFSETVDAWEVVDSDVALAVDAGGALHLAYVDGDEQVVYARRDP